MNIVLAHGILGFDQIHGIEYFNGIKKHLESKYKEQYNLKVITPAVDPTASIEDRGNELRKKIFDAFTSQDGKPPELITGEQTHIIAHSMGGLDSRYILSPNNPAQPGERHIAEIITSLTTIGTPHKGSPIADLVYRAIDGKADLALFSKSEKVIIDLLKVANISNKGMHDLTTNAMQIFNDTYSDNKTVHYFWAAGVGRRGCFSPKTSQLFLPLHEYIRLQSLISLNFGGMASDGMVPLSSAKREEKGWMPMGTEPKWYADHADEVGHDLDNYISPLGVLTDVAKSLKNGTGTVQPPSPYILAKYDEIVEYVAQLQKKQVA